MTLRFSIGSYFTTKMAMMRMMTPHHHAQQQESMLQTDFVVASNLIFWKNCPQQQKAKTTEEVQIVF